MMKTKTKRDPLKRDPKNPVIARIREERGLAVKIAEACGLSRVAVWMWKRVPAEHVIPVSELLGIARYRIRPDIYPPPRGA